MQIILLERVDKLGAMGDEVSVKAGFARNFLLPQGRALRANAENRVRFERERERLEALNEEKRKNAEGDATGLDNTTFVLIRQAGESGLLYGSVSSRDIAEAVVESGAKVARGQVVLDQPIKTLGLHEVKVRLHPEVTVTVTANVARTPDEAERQERGEDVIGQQANDDRAVAEAQAAELMEAGAEMRGETDGSELTAPDGETDGENVNAPEPG